MASIVELFSLWTMVSPSLSTDMATELVWVWERVAPETELTA